MGFDWNFLLSKFQPSQLAIGQVALSLTSFVPHVTRDVKFDALSKIVFANNIKWVYRVM